MTRIRADYVFGTISTTGGISAAATTFDSAGLARLPAVSGSDVAALVFGDAATGNYEIVHVAAHTAAATTATILRGQEGSTAQAWASGTTWLHGPTAADFAGTGHPEVLGIALSDEATAITTGAAKVTMRMPFAMNLTAVRGSLTTASSSGIPTVDINEGGATVLSTKLTIDAGELTSTTAATPAVISDAALADDAEITFDVDVAGTGAKGLKVWLIGTRA